MKKIFSKKSGFTLAEIVIAFAVFSIMAAMLLQVINLSITQKQANQRFENSLQEQEKTFVAKGKTWEVDDEHGINGDLIFLFKDKDDKYIAADPEDYKFDYQLRSAYGDPGELGGLHYFVADGVIYNENLDYTWTNPEGGADPNDPEAAGGASQMSRFDTRITGTKGINSVSVTWSSNAAKDEYTFTVRVDDSGVESTWRKYSQVSLFFGEGKSGGKRPKIVQLNDGTIHDNAGQESALRFTKTAGENGVNIHCMNDSGFGSSTRTFTVKFAEPIQDIGFGDNTSGSYYGPYQGKYANIFGAYASAADGG